jgi:hypothetical protein
VSLRVNSHLVLAIFGTGLFAHLTASADLPKVVESGSKAAFFCDKLPVDARTGESLSPVYTEIPVALCTTDPKAQTSVGICSVPASCMAISPDFSKYVSDTYNGFVSQNPNQKLDENFKQNKMAQIVRAYFYKNPDSHLPGMLSCKAELKDGLTVCPTVNHCNQDGRFRFVDTSSGKTAIIHSVEQADVFKEQSQNTLQGFSDDKPLIQISNGATVAKDGADDTTSVPKK